MTYHRFLEGLQLRHFSPEELTRQAERVRGGHKNSLPPVHYWKHIVPTLWVADQARHLMGRGLSITSAYRNEDYNRACRGARSSRHLFNSALDLIPTGGDVEALFRVLRNMRAGGTFTGGIGIYREQGFVHLDTRTRNATW